MTKFKIISDPTNGKLAGDCNVHEKAAESITTAEIGRGFTDDKISDAVPAVLITKRDRSKEMAELFGLKLDERFKVKFPNGEISRHEFWFVSMGGVVDDVDCARSDIVMSLLQGTAQIVKLPWKPKDGDKVYFVTPIGYVGNKPFRSLDPLSLFQLKNNLLYKTFADAQANVDKDVSFYNDLRKTTDV